MRDTEARELLPSVLIVDPDEGLRALYRTILEPYAEEVLECGDGVAALALVFRTPPSLVVADARLPRVDGLALCECLAAHPRTAPTRKLILAADEWAARRAHASGADHVLVKPFLPQHLVAAAIQLWMTRAEVGVTSSSMRPRNPGVSGGSNSISTTAPHV
ncbi:MAG: chemotaxis protein CheY [Acidobacteria bacterium]|nr:chemotaxis protein CheY [Acidobacteriota bacterium]